MPATKEEGEVRLETAIIMADSFDNRFTPITLEIPRVLCPLVNNPMIHYTLEFLVSNGITKIYIFSCAFAAQIEEHISKTYWAKLSTLKIIFRSAAVDSVGEALRQFDEGEIDSDFVLISGDVVSNMDLQKAFLRHHQIRKKDKTVLMSSVFKKASPHHRSRAGEDTTIVALRKQTHQLLHLDNSSSAEVNVQHELFKEKGEIELRYDLFDCHIDLCSADVINVFQDEFDWRDLRKDFILGILESEILNYKVHVQVLEDEYAARVRSLNTYAAISRDIVCRWSFPLVPDSNISGFMWDQSSYSYTRPNIYMEQGVQLDRTSQIQRGTVVGSGTSVGEDSVLKNSVIGRNCTIGNQVTITNSFLWDNVVVEDGCSIVDSIVCCRATVKSGCKVSSGCILSFDCTLGPDTVLEPQTKITVKNLLKFNDFKNPTEPIDIGEGGKGFRWCYDEGDPTNSLNFNPYEAREHLQLNQAQENTNEVVNQTERFQQDIYDVAFNGFVQKQQPKELSLQINSIKYSHDCNWGDCASALVPVMMMAAKGNMKELVSTLEFYAEMISQYLPSVTDEEELIFAIQEFCESDRGAEWAAFFKAILWQLYDRETISEEAILKWAREHEDAGEGDCQLLLQCADFIEFLQNAEEEEEEEGEDEEGDEGDDE